MQKKNHIEFVVGLFMLAGMLAFFILAVKVSHLSHLLGNSGYEVVAEFDNIGDLKPRSPVTIAGVKIGSVSKIDLDPQSFKAKVHMVLNSRQKNIPTDTSARILTQGLLGGNYISLAPGFSDDDDHGKNIYLHAGSELEETHQAIILEDLIGQFLFSINNKDSKKS